MIGKSVQSWGYGLQKMGEALGTAAKTNKVKKAAAYIVGDAPVS